MQFGKVDASRGEIHTRSHFGDRFPRLSPLFGRSTRVLVPPHTQSSQMVEPTSTTAQRLAALVDTARFEQLATAVLRIARPELLALVHTGMNEAGQTVIAPVDGIAARGVAALQHLGDAGTPVVLLAHTTTARPQLRTKWLAPMIPAAAEPDGGVALDQSAETMHVPVASRQRRDRAPRERRGGRPPARPPEPGDVTKAIAIAARLREQQPETRVLLILTTNRVPDVELVVAVQQEAARGNIELEIFDQSSLCHVLDFTADGTAVRRRFLGITTGRVSAALLTDLSRTSRTAYAAEHPGLSPAEWIERKEDETLEHTIAAHIDGPITVVGLLGDSGTGKSALALRALDRHAARDGIGLWVRAEHVRSASSLAALIDRALRDWHPGLDSDAGSATLALPLLQSIDETRDERGSEALRFIVDDLMRVANPIETLRHLVSLARGYQAPAGTSPGRAHAPNGSTANAVPPRRAVQIIVPCWPAVWQALDSRQLPMWTESVFVNLFPFSSTKYLLTTALSVRGVELDEDQAAHAAEQLHGDPLLTALVIESELTSAADVATAVQSAFARFIDSAVRELAESGDRFTVGEYGSTLRTLGRAMLRARVLEPTWSDVRRWLAPESLSTLREIVRQGRVCRTTDVGGVELLRFRHDRLRDAILARACIEQVESGDADTLLAEPFLARYVGGAIRHGAIAPDALEALCEASPAALGEALRGAGNQLFVGRERVAQTLRSWIEVSLANPTLERRRSRQLDIAFECVAWSHIAERLALLAPWAPYPVVLLARLSAGSVLDGLRYLEMTGWSGMVRDEARDAAIATAVARDRRGVIDTLRAIITDPAASTTQVIAAVEFAGQMRACELHESIAQLWPHHTATPSLVMAGLISALQTAPDDASEETAFEPALSAWRRLPDNDGTEPLNMSSRWMVVEEAQHALPRGLSESGVAVLLRAFAREAERDNGLRHELATLLKPVDHPSVQEALVRYGAMFRAQERARGDGVSWWLMTFARDWDADVGPHRRVLSERTRARLRTLWQDESEPSEVRDVALQLWEVNARRDELSLLGGCVQHDLDPSLYTRALVRRLALGDRTAVPEALQRAGHEPVWYWYLAPVWDDRVRLAVLTALDGLSEALTVDDAAATHLDEMLRQLIKRAPAAEATHVLEACWATLRSREEWVRVALAVATQSSIRLAHNAIADGVSAAAAFQYVNHDWRFDQSDGDERAREKLDAVEPFLNVLSEHFLRSLASGCRKRGWDVWAREHLVPILPPRIRLHYYPTDDDLVNDLARAIDSDTRGKPGWEVERWLRDREDDAVVRERIIRTAFRLVEIRADLASFEAAARALQLVGTRRDLDRFLEQSVEGDAEEIEILRINTSFAVRARSGGDSAS